MLPAFFVHFEAEERHSCPVWEYWLFWNFIANALLGEENLESSPR